MAEDNVMLNESAASLGIEYKCNFRGGWVPNTNTNANPNPHPSTSVTTEAGGFVLSHIVWCIAGVIVSQRIA